MVALTRRLSALADRLPELGLPRIRRSCLFAPRSPASSISPGRSAGRASREAFMTVFERARPARGAREAICVPYAFHTPPILPFF